MKNVQITWCNLGDIDIWKPVEVYIDGKTELARLMMDHRVLAKIVLHKNKRLNRAIEINEIFSAIIVRNWLEKFYI